LHGCFAGTLASSWVVWWWRFRCQPRFQLAHLTHVLGFRTVAVAGPTATVGSSLLFSGISEDEPLDGAAQQLLDRVLLIGVMNGVDADLLLLRLPAFRTVFDEAEVA